LDTAKKPVTSTPETRPQISSSSPAEPSAIARRRGSHAPSQRPTVRNSSRSERATISTSAADRTPTARITGHTVHDTEGIPNVERISFCQPTWRQAENSTPHVTTATSTPTTTVRARPCSVGTRR
jgi:hypothetical protein